MIIISLDIIDEGIVIVNFAEMLQTFLLIDELLTCLIVFFESEPCT